MHRLRVRLQRTRDLGKMLQLFEPDSDLDPEFNATKPPSAGDEGQTKTRRRPRGLETETETRKRDRDREAEPSSVRQSVIVCQSIRLSVSMFSAPPPLPPSLSLSLRISSLTVLLPTPRPRGLTFTWWGCCGLCQRHEPTELAHSFLIPFLCLFLSLWPGPFNCISFHKFSRHSPLSHSVLPVLFLPYRSCQLYISVLKSPSALI